MQEQDQNVVNVAVFGASGFVGRAVVDALIGDGCVVKNVTSPRLDIDYGTDPTMAANAWVSSSPDELASIVAVLEHCDAVVNAAGLATPTASERSDLWGADAVLPVVIALAAEQTSCRRFVHISSAAVQGSQPVLDEGPAQAGHSPYARAKAAGEQALARFRERSGPSDAPTRLDVVVYRPTSVLGQGRPVASRLAQVLRSRWLMIPPGDPALPVALVEHVGQAASFLVRAQQVPAIVLHPSEAMTVRTLASAFGRTTAIRTMPKFVAAPARALVRLLAHGGPVAGQARRVELLWEGQQQQSSLPALGFDPGGARVGYEELGRQLDTDAERTP